MKLSLASIVVLLSVYQLGCSEADTMPTSRSQGDKQFSGGDATVDTPQFPQTQNPGGDQLMGDAGGDNNNNLYGDTGTGSDTDDSDKEEMVDLEIKALRVDGSHRSVTLEFKSGDDEDDDYEQWIPASRDNTKTLKDFCPVDKVCDVQIRQAGSKTVVSTNSQHFRGLEQGSKLVFGFEKGGGGTDYNDTDEIIIELSLVDSDYKVTSKGMTTSGSPCTTQNWVQDRGCNGN